MTTAEICFLIVLFAYISMFVSSLDDYKNDAIPLTPKAIFEGTNLNFPSSLILWTIMFLLNPIFFIASLLRWAVKKR